MTHKSEGAKAKAPAKKTRKRAGSAVGAPPKAKAKGKPKHEYSSKRKTAKPSRVKKSSAPSRAREGKKRGPGRPPKAKTEAKKQASDAAIPDQPTPIPAFAPRGRGRPKDTPDVWTQEHIDEVAEQFWKYIESTNCPTEAEFCYLYLIDHQRLGEIPVLRRLKDFMFAKRQAYTVNKGISLRKGDGPRGAFLQKLAANAGPFSLVDKSESTIRGGSRPFSGLSDEELEKVISDELARRANG